MLVQYLTRKLPMVPQGAAFCWAHVADIAAGHLLAMEHGRAGENYFLAGPPHTIREALQIAEQISGIPAPRLSAPAVLLRGMSSLMSGVERVLPVPDMFRSEYLRTTAGATYLGDNAKARRELGWSPRPLAEGLAETLAYEMRQLGMPAPGGTPIA
jgi:nucleoside-diphosphate-sugar epimerase